MRFFFRFSFAVVTCSFVTEASAQSSCFPACRKGFVCTAEGKCVSECNPPCGSGETCRSGECVSSQKIEDEVAAKTPPPDGHFGAFAGPVVFAAKTSAPGLGMAFRYKTSGDHAFVVGPRAVLGLPEGPDFVVLGLDGGYRGNFASGSVQIGLLALAQPQFWVGGSDALFYIGGAVGPFVQFGRVEIQLPLGGGLATLLRDPFQGRSRDLGGVFTASLMGGIVF
jgi:hypothetical protein